MAASKKLQQDTAILIELRDRNDLSSTIDVAITPNNIVEKSSEALNKAMETVKNIAERIAKTTKDIPISERPHEIDVEFGLKLTTDANAFVVNAGVEAHFKVVMKWKRKSSQDELNNNTN